VTANQQPAQRTRGLGRATPVAIIATVVPILGSVATVAVAPFLAPWLREHGFVAAVYFVIIYALLAAIAVAPTYSTTVLAGWTFGFQLGFAVVATGTLTGATLCYLLAGRLAGERVSCAFREHPKWDLIRHALVVESVLKTVWIVFLLRLSPVLPFGTTNVLLATTGVKLPIYITGTFLGLAPRLGLIALAAAGAERLDLSGRNAASGWWFLALGVVATGLCIAVMIVIGKRALDRATRGATALAENIPSH
jgi:uncharacterized membrane protein YdjX (TVP38/TMEM64 family)